MKGFIYKITNVINNKVYIGQTRQKPLFRFSLHKSAKDNCPIHAAFRKYGIENFKFEILEEVEFEDNKELIDNLNMLEINMIKRYNCLTPNGYNIEIGGNVHVIDKCIRCKNNKVVNNIVFLPKNHNLLPLECLMFLTLQLYVKNSQCNTSYDILHKQCGLAVKTISKLLKSIENKGYITINRTKNDITYVFNKFEKGEPFSYDFLDKPDLTFTEKSYIVATQQYMFKDSETLEGKVSFKNNELSQLIKMSPSTITRCNHSLQKKGYLEGASESIKKFQLRELDQMIIWKLQQHEEQIQKNTEDIALINQRLSQLEAEKEELKKKLEAKNVYIL